MLTLNQSHLADSLEGGLSEQLAALGEWYVAWRDRLYGSDPAAVDNRRPGLWMPTPEGRVWMRVEAAHEALGDSVVAVLRAMRRRSEPRRRILGAADVRRLADWYLPRRVVDQVREAVKLRPVPDEELASAEPMRMTIEETAVDKIATRQAMAMLPPSERRAISLEVCGFDAGERARTQRVSLEAERKRRSRGRAHLRGHRCLTEER